MDQELSGISNLQTPLNLEYTLSLLHAERSVSQARLRRVWAKERTLMTSHARTLGGQRADAAA